MPGVSARARLHGPVRPLALVLNPRLLLQGASDVNFAATPSPKIAVRIAPDDVPGILALLEQTWQRVAPDQSFSYTFLDQTLDSQYRREERLGQIVGIASLLAIVIACLGLFGLAALAVVRRTKEIGVRKVLGASAPQLVLLLSKDFVRLVVAAFVLAVPAIYAAMNAYRNVRVDLSNGWLAGARHRGTDRELPGGPGGAGRPGEGVALRVNDANNASAIIFSPGKIC